MHVIRTGKSLADLFQTIVENSIKSKLHNVALSEKEVQDTTSQALGTSTQDSSDDTSSEPSKTMAADSDSDRLKTGEVDADSIITKLNAIRSGKSFRDDAVKHAMEEYVQSLKTAERTALLAFLKGIAQIVTGEVGGTQASDPSDPAPAVKMKKDGADSSSIDDKEKSQHKTIKPNVIVKHSGGTEKKKPSAEDTSAPLPLPIKPKQK